MIEMMLTGESMMVYWLIGLVASTILIGIVTGFFASSTAA